MDNLDEQLDAARAEITGLQAQLATLSDALQASEKNNSILVATNAELTDNLAATKDKLVQREQAVQEAQAVIDRLKAEAKSAEERAAEYYGLQSGSAADVTAKGETTSQSVLDRFKAITTPAGQTHFLRSLTESERASLFSNL